MLRKSGFLVLLGTILLIFCFWEKSSYFNARPSLQKIEHLLAHIGYDKNQSGGIYFSPVAEHKNLTFVYTAGSPFFLDLQAHTIFFGDLFAFSHKTDQLENLTEKYTQRAMLNMVENFGYKSAIFQSNKRPDKRLVVFLSLDCACCIDQLHQLQKGVDADIYYYLVPTSEQDASIIADIIHSSNPLKALIHWYNHFEVLEHVSMEASHQTIKNLSYVLNQMAISQVPIIITHTGQVFKGVVSSEHLAQYL